MTNNHSQSNKPVPSPSPNLQGGEQNIDKNPTSQRNKKSPPSALGGDLEGGQATKPANNLNTTSEQKNIYERAYDSLKNPTSQRNKKSPPSALVGDLEGGRATTGWAHTHTPYSQYKYTKEFARQMRNEPTSAEKALWQRLRKRQVHNAKFRRQHTIDSFIVDFFAPEERLVIEVDGIIHEYQLADDINRQLHLESLGLIVLRFTNGEVLKSIDAVIERIGEAILEIQFGDKL